jgi:hypothetical protein
VQEARNSLQHVAVFWESSACLWVILHTGAVNHSGLTSLVYLIIQITIPFAKVAMCVMMLLCAGDCMERRLANGRIVLCMTATDRLLDIFELLQGRGQNVEIGCDMSYTQLCYTIKTWAMMCRKISV